ncbi:MAG: LuxR family transcriptional regulator [Acidimicrobiales bacterium]|nr:LuxR family transcriptional regulator [Acidimicrobiales bacterium]
MLIVDDHPVVREGFSQLFEFVDGIEPVGTAAAGDEAMKAIPALEPDLVLLDMHLPGDDGATVAARIRKEHPKVRIIIFTAGAEASDIRRARAAGVDGVLLKTMPVGELIHAIKEAADGHEVIDRDLAGVLPSPNARTGRVPLSEREMEVLGLLSKGMTNKEIAVELFISRATVKSHIENILRKLQASDRAAAVAEGFRRGLLLT